MKFIGKKKSVEVLFLALGFFLLIVSMTFLNRPWVNQGVQAMGPTSSQIVRVNR